MIYVCPRDVKKCWYREPYQCIPVLLRKEAKVVWTEKHRNVARKIFLEGGWTKKRLFDIGWSDVSQFKPAKLRKAQRSTGFTTVRNGPQ